MKEKIGIIGYGHLGSALEMGYSQAGLETQVNSGSVAHTQAKLRLAGQDQAKAVGIEQMVDESSIIALCVRSNDLENVARKLSSRLDNHQIVLSFLAQTSLLDVINILEKQTLVVKVMTTLGVAERRGVSAYQLSGETTEEKISLVKRIAAKVSAAGCLFQLNTEEEMQLFTVAVGCFPGILAYILAQLAFKVSTLGGTQFANYDQTFPILLSSSANQIVKSGSAQKLLEKVATPNGVTAEITKTLEQLELGEVIDQSIIAGLQLMQLSSNK